MYFTGLKGILSFVCIVGVRETTGYFVCFVELNRKNHIFCFTQGANIMEGKPMKLPPRHFPLKQVLVPSYFP